MKSTVSYEWDYETVDEDGDIIDHNHSESLSRYGESDKTDTLVLIRELGNDRDGMIDRTWAYVKDGKMPEYFTDSAGVVGAKVPERFHKELAKYLNQ